MHVYPSAGERAVRHHEEVIRRCLFDGGPDEGSPDPPSLHRLGHPGVHQHHPVSLDLVDELRLGSAAVPCDHEAMGLAIVQDGRASSAWVDHNWFSLSGWTPCTPSKHFAFARPLGRFTGL